MKFFGLINAEIFLGAAIVLTVFMKLVMLETSSWFLSNHIHSTVSTTNIPFFLQRARLYADRDSHETKYFTQTQSNSMSEVTGYSYHNVNAVFMPKPLAGPLPSSATSIPTVSPQSMSTALKSTNFSDLMVYLDWPRPSVTFGLLNYRSLESWLAAYPAAAFRVLVFAPTYALHYKFADALSVMTFQK